MPSSGPSARPRRWRCCSWTWTASRRSTTAWATRPGIACSSRSPNAWRPASGRATRLPASAAMSSPCSSRTPATTSNWPRSPSGSWRTSASPSSSTTASSTCGAAWASPAWTPMSTGPISCCATPTWPCTGPRRPATADSSATTRACTPSWWPGSSWRPTCAGPWRSGSCTCTISPPSTWARARSWAPRPWPAGATRSGGWSLRPSSSPGRGQRAHPPPRGLGAARGQPAGGRVAADLAAAGQAAGPEHQPVRPTAPVPRGGRRRGPGPVRERAAPGLAGPGDDRERAHGRRRERPDHPAPAQGPGARAGHRRLRHRLLLAQLPAPVPGRHAEDRPLVRGAAQPRQRQRRAGPDDRPSRPEPAAGHGGRGGRGLGPVPGPAPHGLRHRPGLLLRPTDGERGDRPPARRRPAGPGPQAGHHGLTDRSLAEDLVHAAELAQAGLGLAADPAADRLHRHAQLPGRGLLGEAFALEHARQPLGEGAVVGAVAAHRREGAAGTGRAAQDVDLDALGEDPEAHLDLAAVGAGRVQQGGEDGVVELLAARGGQGGVAQVAQDELADVGDGRGPGREGLGDHEDRVDDHRLFGLDEVAAVVGDPVVANALLQRIAPRRRQFVRL